MPNEVALTIRFSEDGSSAVITSINGVDAAARKAGKGAGEAAQGFDWSRREVMRMGNAVNGAAMSLGSMGAGSQIAMRAMMELNESMIEAQRTGMKFSQVLSGAISGIAIAGTVMVVGEGLKIIGEYIKRTAEIAERANEIITSLVIDKFKEKLELLHDQYKAGTLGAAAYQAAVDRLNRAIADGQAAKENGKLAEENAGIEKRAAIYETVKKASAGLAFIPGFGLISTAAINAGLSVAGGLESGRESANITLMMANQLKADQQAAAEHRKAQKEIAADDKKAYDERMQQQREFQNKQLQDAIRHYEAQENARMAYHKKMQEDRAKAGEQYAMLQAQMSAKEGTQGQLDLQKRMMADADILWQAYRTNLINKEQYERKLAELGIYYSKQETKIKIENTMRQVQATVSLGASLFKQLAEHNRHMLGMAKAMAIAEVNVNSISAMWRAYKELPIWLAIPTVALLAAKAVSDIHLLTATSEGGIVSGSTTGGISLPTGNQPTNSQAATSTGEPSQPAQVVHNYYYGSLWDFLDSGKGEDLARKLIPYMTRAQLAGAH
jgi:hypothetical protein